MALSPCRDRERSTLFVREQNGVGLADSGMGDTCNRILRGFLTPEALSTFGGKRYTHLWGDTGTFVEKVNARDPHAFPCTAPKHTPK